MQARQFPQTVLYHERITMSLVEAQYTKYYPDIEGQMAPLLGSLNGMEWTRASVDNTEAAFYDVISQYYANSEISCDDIDYWVKRFNAIFNIKYAEMRLFIDSRAIPFGNTETMERHITDQNTFGHTVQDVYKRNGSNTTKDTRKSGVQNAVTNLEKSEGESTGETTYGEGSSNMRTWSNSDNRQTDTNYTRTEITAADIARYFDTDMLGRWIDAFHALFMEVL